MLKHLPTKHTFPLPVSILVHSTPINAAGNNFSFVSYNEHGEPVEYEVPWAGDIRICEEIEAGLVPSLREEV